MSPTDLRHLRVRAEASSGSPRRAPGSRAGTRFWLIAAAFLTVVAGRPHVRNQARFLASGQTRFVA
jgi:hypothetical protein